MSHIFTYYAWRTAPHMSAIARKMSDTVVCDYRMPFDHYDRCCVFSSSVMASSSSTHQYTIWDPQTGTRILSIHDNADASHVGDMVFSRDGQLLATVADETAKIWQLFACPVILYGHTGTVMCCDFSPDGLFLVTGSADKTLILWNVQTHTSVCILRGHVRVIWDCAFSSDGSMIASGSGDMTIKIWGARDGLCIHTFREHTACVVRCIFSPQDATLLATTSSDRTVKLWNVYTGKCVCTFHENAYTVIDCDFTPDGLYLAGVSYDKIVKIWSVYTGTCAYTLYWDQKHISGCRFSRDGSLFAVSGTPTQIWRVPHYLRPSVKVLLMILMGYRVARLRLPHELWAWMMTEGLFS